MLRDRQDHHRQGAEERVSYAAKNGQIVLPTPAVKRRQGQAALYFTKDLIVAWTEYRQAGVDVPPLKQEISALF